VFHGVHIIHLFLREVLVEGEEADIPDDPDSAGLDEEVVLAGLILLADDGVAGHFDSLHLAGQEDNLELAHRLRQSTLMKELD